MATRSKYGAQPTMVDGIRFASKKEARRYGELRLLEKAGELHNLRVQPSFDLCVPVDDDVQKVGTYRADFDYCVCDIDPCVFDAIVVEDVKGVRTPVYRLKKRMVEAMYGIEIREV
jgi:hypothetical protein